MMSRIEIVGPRGGPRGDPSAMIMKIESRTLSALEPGIFAEWHQNSRKVYMVRTKSGRVIKDGILIGEASTSHEVKQIVAAYALSLIHI